MNSMIEQHFAVFFPFFFVAIWLAVTTILGLLSGWFRLVAKYPDENVEPVLRVRGQSGTMGLGVGMHGILTLSVCASGLRVGMTRIFGPFCRDFFVPWEEIVVTRKTLIVWPVAELRFGMPAVGKLRIAGYVADRLARAASGRWPETGPFPEEKTGDVFRSILAQWVMVAGFAALFFTLVPLAVAPSGNRPPIVVAILFSAIAYGVVSIVNFFVE